MEVHYTLSSLFIKGDVTMNSNYSFIKPKFKNDIAILNADIASLKFALDLNNRDDIVSDFLKFHHSATKNIRNSKINLLDSIPHEKFKMIIYKWGMLYEKYYKFLQKNIHLMSYSIFTPS